MAKTRIADLRSAVEAASERWPERRPSTAVEAREYLRYSKASSLLIADVERSEPLTGTEMTREPAPFGIRLMFRTCYIAALLAKSDGLSVEELSEAVREPNTRSLLSELMQTTPRVAFDVEETIGLVPTQEFLPTDKLGHWQFHDGLTYNNFDTVMRDSKRRLDSKAKGGECPLHKAKFNGPMFDAVVHICERDESLFERSLRS